jgi:chromosome segregation ATPase
VNAVDRVTEDLRRDRAAKASELAGLREELATLRAGTEGLRLRSAGFEALLNKARSEVGRLTDDNTQLRYERDQGTGQLDNLRQQLDGLRALVGEICDDIGHVITDASVIADYRDRAGLEPQS